MFNLNNSEPTINSNEFKGPLPKSDRGVKTRIYKNTYFTIFEGYQVEAYIAYRDGRHYLAKDYLVTLYPILQKMNFVKANLYGGINENGVYMFFPIYEPKTLTHELRSKQLLERVEKAKTCWLKIDEQIDCSIRIPMPFTKLAKPEPELSINQMLVGAFPGRFFIDSPQHELLKHRYLNPYRNDVEILIQ